MKPFEMTTDTEATADQVARELLEVVPTIMAVIRGEMRRRRDHDLSLVQFRTLAFLGRRSGVSLSDVADHIGLTLPSTSKLIDGLVERGLVSREQDPADRRRLILCLTGRGEATVDNARSATEAHLAELLAGLPADQRGVVSAAFAALRAIFGANH